MNNWQLEHRKTIDSFLEYLNNNSDSYILKGGTALLTCYKLDRFSEDIDLDSKKTNIKDIVDGYCKKYNYDYRIAKDTDTVKRCMVNYGNNNKPLKIEVSLRRREINDNEINTVNGIKVYNIDTLCIMKANAYAGRDKIRDLYDLTFIVNNYFDNLHPQTIYMLQNTIEYKGIEQFDYLIQNQKDELINEDKLVENFLSMFDKLGLLSSSKEREIINSYSITNEKDIVRIIKEDGFKPTRQLVDDMVKLNQATNKFNTLKDVKKLLVDKDNANYPLVKEIANECKEQELGRVKHRSNILER
jgi:predicted nucleotidyltransferase component of viral defense system